MCAWHLHLTDDPRTRNARDAMPWMIVQSSYHAVEPMPENTIRFSTTTTTHKSPLSPSPRSLSCFKIAFTRLSRRSWGDFDAVDYLDERCDSWSLYCCATFTSRGHAVASLFCTPAGCTITLMTNFMSRMSKLTHCWTGHSIRVAMDAIRCNGHSSTSSHSPGNIAHLIL